MGFGNERKNVAVVKFDSIAARTEVHSSQSTRLRYCLCQVYRNPSVVDVLQRPAERPGFILPTALQARHFPAYRSGKALPATTPLSPTQSQYTAQNYTELDRMQRTTQREQH